MSVLRSALQLRSFFSRASSFGAFFNYSQYLNPLLHHQGASLTWTLPIKLLSLDCRSFSRLKTMKIESDAFRALLTPQFLKLSQLFTDNGYEIRIAGGAVRDILLGNIPSDVDFATTATPQEMVELFEKNNIRMINRNGIAHGTVTARIEDSENFEVTTLRIDVKTDGRHAVVEFTKDWELDASRRDLTVNSMFLTMDGTLVDYFTGKEDLENRRIRFVGIAADRIKEDYLRILRYFRFYGRLAKDHNSHDNETLISIRQNSAGLAGIAGERLWTEFKKILIGGFAPQVVSVMFDVGVTDYLGLPNPLNVTEFSLIWEHLKSLDPHHATCLAALLHSPADIESVLIRLKISNEELSLLRFITAYRDKFASVTSKDDYMDLYQLNPGKETHLKMKIGELLKYCNHTNLLQWFSSWEPPKFPVNGRELAEKWQLLSLKGQGPVLGRVLDRLRLEWCNSRYQATEEDLLSDDIRDRILPEVLSQIKSVKPSSARPAKKMKS